ncbi:hypothetical protein CEUSTIGMA_g6236.t1 [Chlamydomonas eustigma]|uniref:Anaphase-promoting complex subunit 4 WD40 domain-containing protein n=1 Tax=Chlamydomonas eustigma TaxID=1157962 RepID=A0A250X7A9_9CHLO|nr:hypothetical protein CEUSTIGMA_g6236.t1 [Chlamydomonas eustigma]|eukprot:GAX78799.1 hypothetical protein CEUSTIGMA_g6236.t1 [Chlamydomonas eustigma]
MEISASGSAIYLVDPLAAQRLREHAISTDRSSRVFRELWSLNGRTYTAYRSLLGNPASLRSSSAHAPHAGELSETRLNMSSNTRKYTFHGVKLICDESRVAVTIVRFANIRNDLLAFGNLDGDLWVIRFPPEDDISMAADSGSSAPSSSTTKPYRRSGLGPLVSKMPKAHVRAISSLDWSFDNSQLMSVGEDGMLCIWDAGGGQFPGTVQLKCQVSGAFQKDLKVSAVEVSNHHIFAGDSAGFIHILRCEMQGGQLHRLLWQMKLSVLRAQKAPVIHLEFVPFCRATDTPILLSNSRDGTVSLVKVQEKMNRLEIHSWCNMPDTSRDIRAAVCPLSVIQDAPRIVMGAEDSSVYILHLAPGAGQKANIVNTLKGHRAPVAAVSFAFDESLLSSGDSAGTLIVWRRSSNV